MACLPVFFPSLFGLLPIIPMQPLTFFETALLIPRSHDLCALSLHTCSPAAGQVLIADLLQLNHVSPLLDPHTKPRLAHLSTRQLDCFQTL